MRMLIFLLAFISSCFACPQNCLFCLVEPSCSACSRGFILTLNATCLPQSISNCRVQLNTTYCSICEPTFQVKGGQCVKDFSGCVVRNSTGSCLFCWFGTRLSGDTCTGVINCQTAQDNGQCIQCASGYSLIGGSCIDSRASCTTKYNGLCTKCSPHYTLNGFSCLPEIALPPYCSLFDYSVGRCFLCNEGYELYHKYCQRKDYTPLFPASNSNSVTLNALHMQQDFLGVDPGLNNVAIKYSDSIVQDYADLQFKVIVGHGQMNRDKNCWQRDQNGNCLLCFQGYSLVNQACVKASPQCLQFDSSAKLCIQCRPQLVLKNGNCNDNNCAVPIFSRCSKCLNNYSPSIQGICINENCGNFSRGVCVKCAIGFDLTKENLCIKAVTIVANTSLVSNIPKPVSNNPPPPPPPAASTGSSIVGCDLAVNGACLRCAADFYPNGKGGCKRIIIGCLQYDVAELNCVQCIPIYTQTPDGNCVYQPAQQTPSQSNTPKIATPTIVTPAPTPTPAPAPVAAPTITAPTPSVDDNCLVKNNGSCGICKNRYILNPYNFTCQSVQKECLTYNSTNGNCLSCSAGYILFQIWCLGRFTVTDPNCMINDINNYCTSCQPQYYQKEGKCYPVNTQCKSVNIIGGDCLTCYSGYIVINGACVLLSQQPSCIQYDFQSNCIKCAQRYFLQSLVCVPANPLCNNYNSQTGACIDCIAGYGLSSITNNCETIRVPTANCQTADPVGNCLACLSRFYFNTANLCIAANPLCSKFLANGGKCQACFSGYNLLADSSCVRSNLITGCNSADQSGLCVACSSQYILTISGSCLWKDPSCLSYDQNGACTKCIGLYYIQQGKCIKQTMKAKDPNCLINDLMNYCIGCTAGFYISAGNCLLADQLCRTFDTSNGYCLTCYNGYRLYKNKCFLDNPIFNCQQFSGSNCVICQSGYLLKSDGSCAKN